MDDFVAIGRGNGGALTEGVFDDAADGEGAQDSARAVQVERLDPVRFVVGGSSLFNPIPFAFVFFHAAFFHVSTK